jgi:hypothetical protein
VNFTSHLAWRLPAHAPARLARFPVSGTGLALTCSPWSAAFPPQPPLAISRFVRLLRRYYAAVRLHAAVHERLTAHRVLPPARPLPAAATGSPGSRVPRGPQFPCMHGVFGSAEPRAPRDIAHRVVAFRSARRRRLSAPQDFGAPDPAYSSPVQRFQCSLTVALTWLGARVVRYAFPVRLFHSLLHVGLSRRYLAELPAPQCPAPVFITIGSPRAILTALIAEACRSPGKTWPTSESRARTPRRTSYPPTQPPAAHREPPASSHSSWSAPW